MAKRKGKSAEFQVVNRKARHDYHILDTIECGIVLVGSEVKSIRDGRISLGEGYAKTAENPLHLELFSVHIDEYSPASHRQHNPTRGRTLLAHKREIRKLHAQTERKGVTLIPLKLYFKDGWAKILLGIATGKSHHDKRQTLSKRDAQRDIQRAMSKRM